MLLLGQLAVTLSALQAEADTVRGRDGPAGRPNIIMALGDDTGWHGVGWHQSSECRADPDCAMLTPHMEAALQEGIELDQHYTYRFCSPTRASLLTGRLPIHVNQMNSAEYPWTAAAMHPSFVTMADALRSKAGYATHQLGKWHVSTVHDCMLHSHNAHARRVALANVSESVACPGAAAR